MVTETEATLTQRVAELEAQLAAAKSAYQALEQRIVERTDELATLFSVQQAIVSRLDPDAVLQLVVDEARRLTAAERGAVLMLRDGTLEVAVVSGDQSERVVGARMALDETLTSVCIRTGKPDLVLDAAQLTIRDAESAHRLGVRSIVSVPLLAGETPVGVITVAHSRPGAFRQDDLRLLTFLSASAAIAIENARLYWAEQERRLEAERRRRVAEGLRNIIAVLNSIRPVDEVLDAIVTQACELMDAHAGIIHHVDDERQRVIMEASCGISRPPTDGDKRTTKIYNGYADRAIFNRQPYVIPDLDAYVAVLETPDAVGLDAGEIEWRDGIRSALQRFHALLAVPLVVRDAVYGSIVFYYETARTFSDEDVALGLSLGEQAALALENAQLYLEAQRRADESQTLFIVQQAITGDLDLDAVLQLIAEEALRLTGAQRSVVLLLDKSGEKLLVSFVAGEERSSLMGREFLVSDLLSAGYMLRGEPLLVVDADHASHLPPEHVARMGPFKSQISVPLLASSGPLGLIAVSDARSGALGADDVRVLQMLASSAVIGLENARLFRAEQARRAEAEQRRRVAEGLRDILAFLNADRSFDEVLDYIVYQASKLSGASAGVIYQGDSLTNVIHVEAASGAPEELLALGELPNFMENVNRAILDRQPFAVADLDQQITTDLPESVKPLDPRLAAWKVAIRKYYRAYLAVPLIIKDALYGALVLYYPQPRAFSEEDISLGLALAGQVALAIENARLREQAEESAVAAERNRLARDLHDAVTQTLFSASLIADVLPILWERKPEEGRRRLQELRELTRGALAEMRTLLLELRPASLVEAEMGDLLKHLAEAATGRARLPVTLEVECGERRLPPDVQVAFYRIAQEALNNIVKHAEANTVQIHYRFDGAQVALRVVDDGRGFDPAQISIDHLGVGIMRERAEAIGGALAVRSAPGKGTDVRLHWPAGESA